MAGSRKTKKKKPMTNYQRKMRRISRWRNLRRRLRMTFKRGYYATVIMTVVISISASVWWVQSGKLSVMWEGSKQMLLAQSVDMGLSLQYIYLEGRKHAKLEDVTLSLGLEAGDPILGVSVIEIKERLKQLPWVKDAVVERQLPDTLHVHLIERRPMAIWQYQKELRLIDETGKVMEEAKADSPEYAGLMLVVGENAGNHAVPLLRMLTAEPEMSGLVASASWLKSGRWDLKLHNDVTIKLPAKNPERAWAMLAEMERQQQVLSRNIRAVDLRLEDRIFIDMPPDSSNLSPKRKPKET